MICILDLLDHSKAFDTVENWKNFSDSRKQLEDYYVHILQVDLKLFLILEYVLKALILIEVSHRAQCWDPYYYAYILIIYRILRNIVKYVHVYPDDVQIYASGSLNGINACFNNINSDLQKIDIWTRNNGHCINSTKSKCILINRSNRKTIDDIQIKISSNVIEFVSCSKNLGVIIIINWPGPIKLLLQ